MWRQGKRGIRIDGFPEELDARVEERRAKLFFFEKTAGNVHESC